MESIVLPFFEILKPFLVLPNVQASAAAQTIHRRRRLHALLGITTV